ncbi:MAG: hypothetical protein ABI416_18750 [Ginsengibacter sp.]
MKRQSTRKTGNKSNNYQVEIRVGDNEMGIPQNLLGNIFQPFLTTKPTGKERDWGYL